MDKLYFLHQSSSLTIVIIISLIFTVIGVTYSKKHKGLIYAYKVTLRKFFSAFFKMNIYFFLNKKKHIIYKHRFLGLLNSYIGKSSFFRIE